MYHANTNKKKRYGYIDISEGRFQNKNAIRGKEGHFICQKEVIKKIYHHS
jgi:hypothetical protein